MVAASMPQEARSVLGLYGTRGGRIMAENGSQEDEEERVGADAAKMDDETYRIYRRYLETHNPEQLVWYQQHGLTAWDWYREYLAEEYGAEGHAIPWDERKVKRLCARGGCGCSATFVLTQPLELEPGGKYLVREEYCDVHADFNLDLLRIKYIQHEGYRKGG